MDGSSASYKCISNAVMTLFKLVPHGLNKKIVANLSGQVEIKRRRLSVARAPHIMVVFGELK
jgi:hypothetical protein